MPERLCLLSVHAHPDDEASKGAPTVAKYHAEGVRTVLVCCTGGEEGDILNPAMDTPEVRADIGRIRLAELKASTDIIGYDETVLLGYRDSGMPDSEANKNPASFAQAPLDEAVGRLVAVIRRERPQVIITYGDNQTEYPHPDHLRVHEISVLAFDLAGDPDRFPEAGPPFTPDKLYYSVWSGERFREMQAKFEELGIESPFDEKWMARMTRTEPFTTSIDVSGFNQIRGEALKAHATQVDPTSPFWFGLPPEVLRGIHPYDEFRLAQSRVGSVDVTEDDLFAGIRARPPADPLRRAAQEVGPRKLQVMMPALCSSTRMTAVATTPSRSRVTTGFQGDAPPALAPGRPRRAARPELRHVGRFHRFRLFRHHGDHRLVGLVQRRVDRGFRVGFWRELGRPELSSFGLDRYGFAPSSDTSSGRPSSSGQLLERRLLRDVGDRPGRELSHQDLEVFDRPPGDDEGRGGPAAAQGQTGRRACAPRSPTPRPGPTTCAGSGRPGRWMSIPSAESVRSNRSSF